MQCNMARWQRLIHHHIALQFEWETRKLSRWPNGKAERRGVPRPLQRVLGAFKEESQASGLPGNQPPKAAIIHGSLLQMSLGNQ